MLATSHAHVSSSLRDYSPRPIQKRLIEQIIERLDTNDDTSLISSTGSGKTVTSAHLIAHFAKIFNSRKNAEYDPRAWKFSMDYKHIVFIVHLDSLVMQTYKKFQGVFRSRVDHMHMKDEWGMADGITFIKAGMKFDPTKPIVIASLQTLNKRFDHYIKSNYLNPALVIFDECHTTSFSDTGRKLISEMPYRKRIGLTATPFRLEKDVDFSSLWSNCVVAPSFGAMIRAGELCPIVYKQFISADDLKAPKRGEFKEKEVIERFNTPERIAYAIDKWESEAKDRGTIVFTVNVEHGENVRDAFKARGYAAEVISYKTDSKDREPMYDKFAAGEIQILISVRALAVGFDEPSCSCGIDLQPTTSISAHWQKIGRIARTHKGKKNALWLDFTGNIERLLIFGIPDNIELTEDIVMSDKDYTKGKGEAPIKICDNCNAVNHASSRFCKECHTEFPKATIIDAKPSGDLVVVVTKSMVKDAKTAIAYYRSMRHKRFVKRDHPNAAYHDYLNSPPICDQYPLCHPRKRDNHKQWSIGSITGKPSDFDIGIEFLDKITELVNKKYAGEPKLVRALIDSAIWLEFDNDIYTRLVPEIDRYRERQDENILKIFD